MAAGFDLLNVKVLHIINGLGAGGAEALLYRLTTRESYVEHEVISLSRPAWYSGWLKSQNIPVHHLDLRLGVSLISGLRDFRRLVARSHADVVHCWMYRASLLGGLFARLQGIPCVWGIHCASLHGLHLGTRVSARTAGALSPYLASLIVNCSSRSAEFHERLGFRRSRVEVIPNGYDNQIFRSEVDDIAETRASLGVQSGFLVGSITRWDGQKDVPNLLAGLKVAESLGVPVQCLLIGVGLDGGNSKFVAALDRFRCEGLVRGIGPRQDVDRIARAIDLHVLASRSEAFPNSVAETMLSGTPNIVTDVGDAAKLIGDTGWVVPPRCPTRLGHAIAAAYDEYLEQPQKWQSRCEAAARRVESEFSIDLMIRRYEHAWNRLVAGNH